MLGSLAAVLLGHALVSFKISHRVKLGDTLLFALDVKRDGSLVGACGWQWPDAGRSTPLIVIRGKRIRFTNQKEVEGCEVQEFLPNGKFKVSDRQGNPVLAELKGKKLVLHEHIKPPLRSPEPLDKPEGSDDAIRALFPIPEEVNDTIGISGVYWQDYLGGMKLGTVEFSWNMQTGRRVVVRDSAGRTTPLEKLIPGLRNYVVLGLCSGVGEGWFIVEAGKASVTPKGQIPYLQRGDELFWIEPVRN